MWLNCSKEKVLRFFSIFVIAMVFTVFLLTVLFVTKRLEYREKYLATGGKLDLSEATVYSEPVYLNGWWEAFEGKFCTSSEEVKSLGISDNSVSFPIGSITQATKSATYRLRFALPENERENLLVLIPNFYKSADVYLNGVRQEYLKDGEPWLKYSALESLVPLENIDPSKKWQELVITGNFNDQPITLYKRSVIVGTMKNLSTLGMFSSSNELLLVGLQMLILINGYVFMLFRPGHRIISNMTLFDTTILMRSMCSMAYLTSFIKDIFPPILVSDRFSASGALFFLMLGGIVGCKLSAAIYDPDDKARPKWLIKPIPWIYAIFAVIFTLSPVFFERYGKYLLIAVYTVTFVGVFLQFRICLSNKEKLVYNVLQFVKTIYIGVLIFFDIILMDTSTNFLLLFYLYSVFFILHIIVRLYDNNESYREVEILNTSLEDTVRERTRALSEANRILSELSTKDPLTKIFNRLYFENTLEKAIEGYSDDKKMYLCMFDLDFFKKINDSFGHDVGDEQLIFLTKTISGIVKQKATFARLGGEEFVLLFENTKEEEVIEIIEKIRYALDEDAKHNKKHTTASFGVAQYHQNENAKQLLKNSDLALYEAKSKGRNRIAINYAGKINILENV